MAFYSVTCSFNTFIFFIFICAGVLLLRLETTIAQHVSTTYTVFEERTMPAWKHVSSGRFPGLLPSLLLCSLSLFSGCVSTKAYKELEYERDRALDAKRSAEESLRKLREKQREEDIRYTSEIETIKAQEDEIAQLNDQVRSLKKELEKHRPEPGIPRNTLYYSRSQKAKGELDIEINRRTGGLVLKHDILFQGSLSELQSGAKALLTGLVQALEQPSLVNNVVYIDGHTNSTKVSVHKSTYPDNWALGARRASEVCHFLKEQGISPARLVVRSYGYTIPLIPEDPANPDNRRVEIIIGDTISSVR